MDNIEEFIIDGTVENSTSNSLDGFTKNSNKLSTDYDYDLRGVKSTHSGYSASEAATKLNVSKATVHNYLKDFAPLFTGHITKTKNGFTRLDEEGLDIIESIIPLKRDLKMKNEDIIDALSSDEGKVSLASTPEKKVLKLIELQEKKIQASFNTLEMQINSNLAIMENNLNLQLNKVITEHYETQLQNSLKANEELKSKIDELQGKINMMEKEKKDLETLQYKEQIRNLEETLEQERNKKKGLLSIFKK